MNKEIEEQTDSLESIISEVTKLNQLVYTGYSIESLSRHVTNENVDDICNLLTQLSKHDARNVKVHIITTDGNQ